MSKNDLSKRLTFRILQRLHLGRFPISRLSTCGLSEALALCLGTTLVFTCSNPCPAENAHPGASTAKAGGLQGTTADDVMHLDRPAGKSLRGKAEVLDSSVNPQQSFEEGMAEIDKKNYAAAAHLLKIAAAHFGHGFEKDKAESLYFEAGCRVMIGEKDEAANLYRMAWDLFEKYDPRNPYKETAISQLCDLTYNRLRAEKQQKLDAVALKRAQILVDQNIVLEGRVEQGAVPGALVVVDKRLIPAYVQRSFFQMTCLETTELGSNATNAQYRWSPMQVYTKPAAFGIASGFSDPFVKIKVNGRQYSVKINLPNLRPGLRKIILITNKEKVCAIDLDAADTWLLQMKRERDGSISSLSWRKLTHKKN